MSHNDNTMQMNPFRDIVRQVLNIVLAVSQIIITLLGYITQANKNFTDDDQSSGTLVTPAGYAFIIWALIYGGSLAYALFQVLPRQRKNESLRNIGFFTAFAFFATSLWLIAAQNQILWLTVICILGIFFSLLFAFIRLVKEADSLIKTERYLILFPMSIFLGWVSVAMFANTSSLLKADGVIISGFSELIWSILLLIGAGLIGAGLIFYSKGNIEYALTIIWALVAILIANILENKSIIIAILAGIIAILALIILIGVRRFKFD